MENEQKKTNKWTISDSPGCDRYRCDTFHFYCYFASVDSAERVSEMDTFMSIIIILITNSSFCEDEIHPTYTLYMLYIANEDAYSFRCLGYSEMKSLEPPSLPMVALEVGQFFLLSYYEPWRVKGIQMNASTNIGHAEFEMSAINGCKCKIIYRYKSHYPRSENHEYNMCEMHSCSIISFLQFLSHTISQSPDEKCSIEFCSP